MPLITNIQRQGQRVLRPAVRLAANILKSLRRAPPPIYRPHHYLHFELTPDWHSVDGRISHNAYGFRGPDFAIGKANGVTRIVCVGESTTYCDGVADHETWPARLQYQLRENGCAVEVINAGIPAYTSSEVLLNYIFKIEPLKPDWLLYYFTINDVRPRQLGCISRDYREFCRSWSQKPKLRSLRAIETYFAHKNSINYRVRNMLHVDHSETNIFKTDGNMFRANIRDMVTLAISRGARVLLIAPRFRKLTGTSADLLSEDPLSRAVAEHRSIVFDIAAETGQAALDMLPLMPPPPWSKAERSELYFDSVHLTAPGLDMFAGHVSDLLGKHMRPETAHVPTS